MTRTLLYAGIAFLVAVDVMWSVIEHRQGWRGGHFGRGLTRYQPGHNVKTGKPGGPRFEGLHLALNAVVVLAICWLLVSWANGGS